jgi:hypothetical protein
MDRPIRANIWASKHFTIIADYAHNGCLTLTPSSFLRREKHLSRAAMFSSKEDLLLVLLVLTIPLVYVASNSLCKQASQAHVASLKGDMVSTDLHGRHLPISLKISAHLQLHRSPNRSLRLIPHRAHRPQHHRCRDLRRQATRSPARPNHRRLPLTA